MAIGKTNSIVDNIKLKVGNFYCDTSVSGFSQYIDCGFEPSKVIIYASNPIFINVSPNKISSIVCAYDKNITSPYSNGYSIIYDASGDILVRNITYKIAIFQNGFTFIGDTEGRSKYYNYIAIG